MIELSLPATPEGTAASREVMDALDSADLDYEAWEEKDGSISFDFSDSDQDAVLDVMRGLGIDVEQSDEDDPQSGDPMYRTESTESTRMIEQVLRGEHPGKLLDECATCGCGLTEEFKPGDKLVVAKAGKLSLMAGVARTALKQAKKMDLSYEPGWHAEFVEPSTDIVTAGWGFIRWAEGVPLKALGIVKVDLADFRKA